VARPIRILKRYSNFNEPRGKGTVLSTREGEEEGEITSGGSYPPATGLFKGALKAETAPLIKEKPQENLKRIITKERVLRKPILRERERERERETL
jgi:hypothetical protein